MLGGPPAPARPDTHRDPEEVAALAGAAFRRAGIALGPPHRLGVLPPVVRREAGRLIWSVDSATIGAGWRVDLDDATGEAGPVTRWGLR